MFLTERAVLSQVFRDATVRIEHVGSTSVSGLGAKPMIDIMLGVEHLAIVESRTPQLAAAGYKYVPELEAEFPERRYFRKPPSGARTHNLHAVEVGSSFWSRHLLFRDFLRTHPEVAAQYVALNRLLKKAHLRRWRGRSLLRRTDRVRLAPHVPRRLAPGPF